MTTNRADRYALINSMDYRRYEPPCFATHCFEYLA